MGLAQRAEKKVEISKFAQVFPRIFSFFFSYMKRCLLSLNDEGFMQISLHGGGDQKDPQLIVQTQLLPSLGSGFLSVLQDLGVFQIHQQAQTHSAAGPSCA